MVSLMKEFNEVKLPFVLYKVRCHLRDIVGGIPADPNLVEAWVGATCKDKTREEREKIRDMHVSMLEEAADEKKTKTGICFHRKDGVLVIEGRQVKKMLKEAANILKDVVPTGWSGKEKGRPAKGISNFRSHMADQVFVDDRWIPVGIPGKTEPDSIEQKPIHVQTRQGMRDSIKTYELCRDVDIEFTVRRLNSPGKRSVPETALLAVLKYCQFVALGADRSQDRGKFDIVEIDKFKPEDVVQNCVG